MRIKLFYPLLIVCIGLFVYSNTLFNNFVWDDRYQIVELPFFHSPLNIPFFLMSSVGVAESGGKFFDFYYKPLLFSVYSILYFIGGGSSFPFHLLQILIHSINVVFLYYLFKRFINQKVAFILALVFLVHPGNEEAVAYIASLQDVLFFFFGMSALLLCIYKPFKEINRLRLVALFLLLSLLSKETGILFVVMSFLYIFFFEKQLLIRTTIFLSFVLILYSYLRIAASGVHFLMIIKSEVMDISLLSRIMMAPKFLQYYLKEIFVPSDMLVPAKILPKGMIQINDLVLLLGTFIVSFAVLKYVWKTKFFYPTLFFLIWFVVGIGIHLQLLPLDALVAKRWLYFPLAGILGLIGILITKLNIKIKYQKYLLLPFAIFLIGFFAMQTFKMNAYWQDPQKLEINTVNSP